MKKIVLLLLTLALALPALSLADTESELVGTWVGSNESTYGVVYYYIVRLYDDHNAIYEANQIDMVEPYPEPHVSTGTWDLKEDGVHVYYRDMFDKKDEELILELTQAHYLAMRMSTYSVMFVKLPDRIGIGSYHTVTNWD